ncbi:MAG: hypothetical protein Q9219_005037 [cf. Caloplaca sp. 3 TL-2023]
MAHLRTSFLAAVSAIFFVCFFSATEARRLKRVSPQLSSRNTPVDLNSFHVPLSNGTASLPSPTDGFTLKAITLGRGTQNYTCAAGSTAAPVAVGAKADLLDATPLLPLFPSSESQAILNLLPEYLVSFDFATIANSTIPVSGRHIFDAAGVPTFDLGSVGLLKAKKLAGITAPPSACKGANGKGDGAVDWLALTEAPGSTTLKEVYRVHTAGGKAPKLCGGGDAQHFEVQYAAQYWFFG